MKYAILIVILPLFTAFFAPVGGLIDKKFGKYLNLLIYGAGIVLSIIMFYQLFPGVKVVILGGWRPPFGINLYLSPLSYGGALVIYFIAFFIHLADLPKNRNSYYNLSFSLFVFSALGMVLTGDLFNLFIFIEIGSVTTIVLSAAVSERAGSRGSVKYLVPSSLVAMFMLIGISLLYSSLGTLNIAHLAGSALLNGGFAFIVGIAILSSLILESELFPFNSWVPDVYKGSASGFSAALSGIGGLSAMLVMSRIFVTMMGPQTSFRNASVKLQTVLYGIAIISILSGEIAALRERDLKRILAFSSIGQMGIVALSLAVGTGASIAAGLILLINHTLAKPLLLLISGYFVQSTGKAKWDQMRGVGRSFPFLGTLFVVAGLSLMGMPFFVGFWGKLELIKSLFDSGLLAKVGLGAILFSVIIEGVYYMRMGHAFFEEPDKDVIPSRIKGRTAIVVPVFFLVIGLIIFGLFPSLIQGFTMTLSNELLDSSGYIHTILQTVTSAGVGL